MKMITAKRLEGIGEYYFSQKLREIEELNKAGKQIINLGIGSPDLPPHPDVIRILQEEAAKPNVHAYQSYKGSPVLRTAIAEWYTKWYGVTLDPNTEILPLIGSKEGIMHICMTYLNEGDEALIPNPGYPTYTSAVKLAGGTPIAYQLSAANHWEPDFSALEKSDLSKVKLMWVSYPHMPTGVNGTIDLYEKLIAFGKKHQILIVNDNPYSFVLNKKPLSIFQVEGAKEIALELNSLSKTYNMAGWRVGMVLGKSSFIDAILKVKSNIDSGMFYGIQKGAIEALKLGNDWFESQNKVYTSRRDLIFQLAEKLGCTFDRNSVGLFVWAKLPEGKSSEDFIDELLYHKHLFITPGTIFGSNGEGYIRFSLCVKEEEINEAISRF
jgi:aspartate/methionine/tyrosine aminotransferase